MLIVETPVINLWHRWVLVLLLRLSRILWRHRVLPAWWLRNLDPLRGLADPVGLWPFQMLFLIAPSPVEHLILAPSAQLLDDPLEIRHALLLLSQWLFARHLLLNIDLRLLLLFDHDLVRHSSLPSTHDYLVSLCSWVLCCPRQL